MGASERQQQAIARVEVQVNGATQERGTGFLVSADGLVLTAAHVVFDLEADGRPRRPGKIQLFFGTRSAPPPARIEVQAIEDQDLDEDWALLRCAPPAGVEPIPLTELPPGLGAAWGTFGYPKGGDTAKGNGYDGTVKNRYKTHLELESSGTGALPAGADAQGISGAPCLVGEAAVGVIAARPKSGKLLAARADRILQRRPGLRRARLPFEALVAQKLAEIEPLILKGLAKRFRLSDEDLTSPALHEMVARCMIACDLGELLNIIQAKVQDSKALREHAARLFTFFETLWLSGEAAERLGDFVVTERGKAAAINTGELRVGHHYVARASEARECFGEWTVCRFRPDTEHATTEALVAAVREALEAKLRGAGPPLSDKKLASLVASKKPVVLVYDPAVRSAIAATLESKLPGLRVVLLTDAGLTPEQIEARPDMIYITPEIGDSDRERFEEARLACDWTLNELGLGTSEYA